MELQKNKKQPVRGVFKNSSTYLPSDLDFLKCMCSAFVIMEKNNLFSQVKGVLRQIFWGTTLSDALKHARKRMRHINTTVQ